MAADPLHIAIDGPAGSGKSSIAAALAKRLGLTHVDTGAMYRALTLVAAREEIGTEDGVTLAARLAALRLRFEQGELWIDGENVAEAIRSDAVNAAVSAVSAHAAVRAAMVERQREMSWEAEGGCVMEGRDIGTVVLPLARCKIYLDADPLERARRRARQQGEGDSDAAVERIAAEIARRDALDSERQASPLRVAPDAHVLDSTALDFGAVLDRCAELARDSAPPAEVRTLSRGEACPTARYRFAKRWITHLPIFGFLGLKVFGREHEQLGGPYIYACNHLSNFDPLIVGGGIGREVHFLAKSELFFWPLGAIIRCFNAIPIHRRRFDAAAFDTAEAALKNGQNLMIFPEGTRRPAGTPGPVKKGLGLMLRRADVSYLPCFVRGTPNLLGALFRRQPLELWIGPATRLHAVDHLLQSVDERELHMRVGQLYLEQIRALEHRSRWRTTKSAIRA